MTFILLVAATLSSGLLIGLIPTLLDGVQKPLQARLNLSEGRANWFVRLFYLTWLPAMPLAGYLVDLRSTREILLFGLFALILGVAWLALVRSPRLLMLNAVFLGVAYSLVTVAAVRLMSMAFFPAKEDADTKLNIASLNLGFVAVGLGALIGPWVVAAIERWWGFRQGLLYVSVALIIPAALTALCELAPKVTTDVATWEEVFTQPQMILLAGVILLYFALENCLEFWPESYLKELGYENRGLQTAMLIFWLAFIASRAAAAWLLFEYRDYPQFAFGLTIVVVILSAAVLGNLVGGFDLGSGSLGFWLLGACYGPLLPGFLGMALELYPKPLPVSILGALLALSGLDTLLVRPLMTIFGKDLPARTLMRAPTVLALVLAAPLLLLAFWRY